MERETFSEREREREVGRRRRIVVRSDRELKPRPIISKRRSN